MGHHGVSKQNHGRIRHTEMKSILNIIRRQLCFTPGSSRLVLLSILNATEYLFKSESLTDEINRAVRERKRCFQELNAPKLENANPMMQFSGNVPQTARGKLGMQIGYFATLQLEVRRGAGMLAVQAHKVRNKRYICQRSQKQLD
jgi:hypothetical protein